MIIIGEKLNSTLKSVFPALEARDTAAVTDLARRQADAGADYLDVNTGMLHEAEPETMAWLVQTVSEAVDLPLALDSPSPAALAAGLAVHRHGQPLINSITGETERCGGILPLIRQYHPSVIALCMDDEGMPETTAERCAIAERLIAMLTAEGLSLGEIFIDPLVRPVSTGSHYGTVAIETIRQVKDRYPEVHIACGLSNVSYGLPGRRAVNQAFLVAAMAAGMDGAIVDPLDDALMSLAFATEALLGRDPYCKKYIKRHRQKEKAAGADRSGA